MASEIKNTLLDKYPELAKEWDAERNAPLTPESVAPHSNKSVWWICSKGHHFQQSIDKRSNRGYSCPYCSGKRILPGFNDLQTLNPELAREWDHEKNKKYGPTEVALHSNKVAWWKCPVCGHSWSTKINGRANGRGCPVCATAKRIISFRENRYLRRGQNDLATLRPDLAEEWDPVQNGTRKPDDYTCNSNERIWWKCSICGNTWEATIHNRARNDSGCPKCMKYTRTSFPEQALFFYLHKLFPDAVNSYTEIFKPANAELDIFLPAINTGIEYDGKAWHAGEPSKSRAIKKYQLCQEKQIRLIRVSEINDASYCDSFIYREDLSLSGLNQTIKKVIGMISDSGIEIDTVKDRPAIMQQYISSIKGKSIAVRYPNSVPEWDTEKNNGLTPEMVNATSLVNYWWKCEKGHSYQSSPANKLGGHQGCPVCSNRRLLSGYNDLATRYPSIAAEWDMERNYPISAADVMPGSTKKYWWKCEKGHSYLTTPGNRVFSKTGCSVCSGKQVSAGINDLQALNPLVAALWDYEKNGDMSPDSVTEHSSLKVWWKCQQGHSWQKEVRSQVNANSCPICAGRILVKGVNDISTLFPEISKDWDAEKNSPYSPCDFTKTSKKKVWWHCSECGTDWQCSIRQRTLSHTGCPSCGYIKKMQATRAAHIRESKKDLVSLFPEIAAEWDYEKNGDLTPNELSPGANKKVWWKCPKGHSYSAWISDRTGSKRTGCPYCAGKRKLPNDSINT